MPVVAGDDAVDKQADAAAVIAKLNLSDNLLKCDFGGMYSEMSTGMHCIHAAALLFDVSMCKTLCARPG